MKPSEIGYSAWDEANRYTPAERARRQQAQDRASDWGVFPWEAANMYRRESAVRVYRRRCDADRFAEKSDPALNLVVRSLDREVRS